MPVRDTRHPIVTVLMPVFNGQEHLRDAVESILGQTLSSFELLVVNDGSTDDTADILVSYAAKDERVRVVYQPNAGIVAALNAGLALAKGTYIARMDADDIADRKRLEIQVAYMEAHPNCVACGSDYALIGARRGRVRTPRTNAQCQARLVLESCFAHPTVMLRAATLNASKLRYEEAFQYAEDYRLWTRLSTEGELKNIDQALLLYRVHSSQISSNKRQIQQERHALAATAHIKALGGAITSIQFKNYMWPSIGTTPSIFEYTACASRLILELLKITNIPHRLVFLQAAKIATRNTIKIVIKKIKQH